MIVKEKLVKKMFDEKSYIPRARHWRSSYNKKNNKKLAAQIIVLVNYKKLKKVVLHIILLKNSQYFC